MAKKKTSSIFMEPYNLLLIIIQSVALLYSSIAQGFRDISTESKKAVPSDEEGKAAYAAMRANFDAPEFAKNWRTFLLRALCIQGILCLLTIAHLVAGNFWLGLQLLVVFLASIVFFGYKPWIRRNQRVISFITYIRTGLRQDPKSVFLFNSLKGEQ